MSLDYFRALNFVADELHCHLKKAADFKRITEESGDGDLDAENHK